MFCFFFFKQKTAYEMRISDWSSDVCSSDLDLLRLFQVGKKSGFVAEERDVRTPVAGTVASIALDRLIVELHRHMTIAVATAEDLPFIDKEHHVQSVSRALANFNISADRSIRELKVHFVRTGQARRFRDGPEIGRAHVRNQVTNAHLV